MISNPVLISLISGGIFILIIIIFLIWNRRAEKKIPDTPIVSSEMHIDIRDAAQESADTAKAESAASFTATAEPEAERQQPVEPAAVQPASAGKTVDTKKIEEKEEEPFEMMSGSTMEQTTFDEVSSERTEKKEDNVIAETETPDFGGMKDFGSIFDEEPVPESDDTSFTGQQMSVFVIDGDEKEIPSTAMIEEETKPGDKTSELFNIDEVEPSATPEAIFDEDTSLSDIKAPQAVIDESVSPEDIFSDDDVIKETIEKEVMTPTVSPAMPEISEEDIESILDEVAPPPAAKPETPKMSPEDQKRHEKARRIARVIVNDIRNYNPEKLAEGIRAGNIMKTLGMEIERGRQLYIKRVPPDIARSTNYYRESLIKILADGRADLFGW